MSQQYPFAAQILEASASAYAACAASLLLERHPKVAERYAPGAMRDWKSHFTQRILELSAALGVEEPGLFASRVRWAGQAFRARDVETRDLRSSLVCLRDVLLEELPELTREPTAAYVESALEIFDEKAAAVEEVTLDPVNPAERMALRYLRAALQGDGRRAIDVVVDAVDNGLSTRDAYLGVLLAAQREVGRMWHLGELNIAEEHLVTITTERTMAILAQRAPRVAANGMTMISAAVAGNSHDLGVRVLADFFAADGWRAICMGANLPAADLTAAVDYFDTDLLVLSAALATQLKAVRQTIEAVRQLPECNVKTLAGGIAFVEAPDLWRRLGADGHAGDADDAVTLGARLVGLISAGD